MAEGRDGDPSAEASISSPALTGEGWDGMEPRAMGKFWKQPTPDRDVGLTQNLCVFTPPHSVPVLWSYLANVCPVNGAIAGDFGEL